MRNSIESMFANKVIITANIPARLFPEKFPVVETSDKFLTLNWKELVAQPEILEGVIRTFREVYGNKDSLNDPWGEGAYCSKEGWKEGHMVNLQDYESGVRCPSCDNNMEECFPEKKMEERIQTQLQNGSGLITVMFGEQDAVVGFSWGSVRNPEEVRRGFEYYFSYRNEQMPGDIPISKDKTLVIEELVKRTCARRSLFRNDETRHLERPLFQMAISQGANRAIMATTHGTRSANLVRSVGFNKIYDKDGTVIMENKNINPLSYFLSRTPARWIENTVSVARKIF